MAIERNYFITMHHQAGVHAENFTEVKFRDILLTGTGYRDRRLNRDNPGQTGRYGGSTYTLQLLMDPFESKVVYTLQLPRAAGGKCLTYLPLNTPDNDLI